MRDPQTRRLTLVSMSGLRVGHEPLLASGLKLPGLAKRATALDQLPPLGLLTIAATVPHNWEIQLISDRGPLADLGQPCEETIDAIRASAPDLVAFSSLTPAIDRAIHISQELRQNKIPTAVGGLHATAYPEYCEPHFDSVVCGDGELSFPRLLSDFVDGNLQKRYLNEFYFDLANAPLPRWDLLGESRPPRYTLQTQRGCPWACNFCAASRLLGPARSKPLPQILNELDAISDLSRKPWIELADDNTFAVDRDHSAMLEAFSATGMRWFTESDWRIANHPELLRQIARSGCQQILIGVESSVFRYPGMGGKAAELEQITEACVAIQEAGIVVNACFIVGAQGETERSIERLGEFLQSAPFGEIQLTLQTPFPGSGLYRSFKKRNLLIDEDFSRYTLFDVVFRPDQMDAAVLQQSFERLILHVFSNESESRRSLIRKSIRARSRVAKRLPGRSAKSS